MSTKIEIKDLNVGFHSDGQTKQVLHQVSLIVPENKKIGIIGESGSGKTQTVLSILGLISGEPGVISGKIKYRDNFILDTSANSKKQWKRIYGEKTQLLRGHEISIIFQDAKASLIPYRTIEEQAIETWKDLNGNQSRLEIIENARSLLEEMNLSDPERVLRSYPNQLSGGESQRAYIMLALLGSPSLLIADEPTSSLDRENADNLLNIIKKLCSDKKISLLLISHDLRDVIEHTDQIYVLFDGHVLEQFSPKNRTPTHPYTKFLMSMVDGELIKELKADPDSDNSVTNLVQNGNMNEKYACPYYKFCSLSRTLSTKEQQKCKNEKPSLEMFSDNNKSACWHDK